MPVIRFRVRRTNLLMLSIALAIAFIVAVWFFTGLISLKLMIGFKFDLAGFSRPELRPLAIAAAVHDLIFAALVFGRIQDFDRPGWWLLPILAVAFFVPLLALLALFAVELMPGTIGPNRFGRDPRGWHSREHYDRQQTSLRSG